WEETRDTFRRTHRPGARDYATSAARLHRSNRAALPPALVTTPIRTYVQTKRDSLALSKQLRRQCSSLRDSYQAPRESVLIQADLERDAADARASNVHAPSNANQGNHKRPDASPADCARRRCR